MNYPTSFFEASAIICATIDILSKEDVLDKNLLRTGINSNDHCYVVYPHWL
jgi:hypothetical protein